MLPGFRFLLAAIVLCISILVFGLGAAALLRARTEEFASNPSWRGTPEPKLGVDGTRTTLAMLRVEPQAGEQRATDLPAGIIPRDTAPAAAASPEPEPERMAASARALEPGEGETAAAGAAPAAAEPDTPALTAETKIAAVETASLQAAPVAAELSSAEGDADRTQQQAAPTAPDSIATKLAALGDQPTAIEATPKTAASPDQDASKARARAQRAKARRRLARARLAKQQAAAAAAAQQQSLLFPLFGQV